MLQVLVLVLVTMTRQVKGVACGSRHNMELSCYLFLYFYDYRYAVYPLFLHHINPTLISLSYFCISSKLFCASVLDPPPFLGGG